MKLLDLLVRELPKRGGWPSWAAACVQDGNGIIPLLVKFAGHGYKIWRRPSGTWSGHGEDCSWGEDITCIQDFKANQLATDHATRIVTREEYEAATRDFSKLTAPELLKVLQDATSALIDASAQREEVVTPAQRIEQLRNARDAAVKAYDDAFVSGEAELRKLKLGDRIVIKGHNDIVCKVEGISHTEENYSCQLRGEHPHSTFQTVFTNLDRAEFAKV